MAQEAINYVHSGKLGKVGMARTWIHQKRAGIGKVSPADPPVGLDWSLWQGPAPEAAYFANRVHYGWHWFWTYGTGELGNNGIHCVDVARWGLNVDAPLEITSGGGKFVFDDDQEVPDTQIVTWTFPGSVLQYEHRMWSTHGTEGTGFGIAWYGDRGTLVLNDKGFRVTDGENEIARNESPSDDSQARHVANFLECVRSRENPVADIEIGHLSTRLCHLGNIAHRTGSVVRFDAASEGIPHHPAATNLLSREYSAKFPLPNLS
jgi:predicted dehydrogenase